MAKSGQRRVKIDRTNIATEIQNFGSKKYMFAAEPARNDIWLETEFADTEFETAVISYIHRLLGKQYSRMGRAVLQEHC